VQYLFYCRNKPNVDDLRMEHREEHWSFMDGYDDRFIARGPTLMPDRETATGSMHVVDLQSDEEAKVFAYDEPFAKAGVFDEIIIRRWTNALKRTMWKFDGDDSNPRFLFLGHGREGDDVTDQRNALLEVHRAFLASPEKMKMQILRGPLWDMSGDIWVGSFFLLEAPTRDAAKAFFEGEPYTVNGLYAHTEFHDWRFGGRH